MLFFACAGGSSNCSGFRRGRPVRDDDDAGSWFANRLVPLSSGEKGWCWKSLFSNEVLAILVVVIAGSLAPSSQRAIVILRH